MSPAPRAFAPLDLAQIVAVAAIWGVNNIAAKIVLLHLPPLLSVAVRFFVVLVALIPWLRWPPRERWPLLVLTLFCVGPLHFGVQYSGLALAHQLAPMVVAMQLWAPASVVFAALVLGERVGALRWTGVAVAFLGAASMNFDPTVFAELVPLSIVAFASAIYGLGTVLVRKLGASHSPWVLQAWTAMMAAPTMLTGSLLFENGRYAQAFQSPWYVWVLVAFGGIGSSIVASALLFRLVQRYEVSRTTPYLLLSPVISFSLSPLILGDHITVRILIGAAATLAGVLLVAIAERRFTPIASAAEA
ncbi:MAG: DMT family transporter [Terricaulis sp.]